ncbi:pre-mRNA-processing factor 39-like [Mixophyes fleayi]|uniref:pre-mRNA-processing factor 39-like n=1 Tax=Mixophyes fleayi TaxID=3061075 RepID=UPI003F4D84D3
MASQWRFPSGISRDSSSVSGRHSQPCDVLTTEDCSGSDGENDAPRDDADLNMPSSWIAALTKPNAFATWTRLITAAERAKNLPACRRAYDAFLMQYPLSHIYWRKYAEIVQQLGSSEETEKIFNRAVKSNPLNGTLWTSYIMHVKNSMDMTLPKSLEKLDGVFKNAVDAVGMEFYSDGLWNLYIEWEIKRDNLKSATALFDRVLCIPTQQYQLHFKRFKEFVSTHSPLDILDREEQEWIHSKLQIESDSDPIAAEDSPSGDVVESLADSDLDTIRKHIINTREQLHLLNEAEVKKRIVFEEAIKCRYFSSSPLKIKQLQNWRKYLDFEISQGHQERIVILFERCLMTCALYEEFWLAYARYMEGHSVEVTRSVFERACRIHLPVNVNLHLHWAVFEEKHGNVDSARAVLCNLESVMPGLAMVRLKRVSLERRHGNLQGAERLLKEAVQMSAGTELVVFYAVKLARLLLKLQRDPEKAREVIIEALQKHPDNIRLYLCLLEIDISRDAANDVVLCVEQALKSNLNDEAKRYLSHRRLEFLEDYGCSITSLLSACAEHQTLLKEQEDLKRKADNGEKDDKNKKNKTESSAPSAPTLTPPVKDSQDNVVPGISSPPVAAVVNSGPKVIYLSSTAAPKPPRPAYPRTPVPTPRPYFRPPPRPHAPPQFVPGPPFGRARGPVFYRPAYPMGGFPAPAPPPPPPYYNYGPGFQNFGQYNGPLPWHYNRFNPPF